MFVGFMFYKKYDILLKVKLDEWHVHQHNNTGIVTAFYFNNYYSSQII